MKYWEIIADNLSKSGWTWSCVSTVNSRGMGKWGQSLLLTLGLAVVIRCLLRLSNEPRRALQ